MGIVVLPVGSTAKRRATLRGGVASLHATTGQAFATPGTPVDNRHEQVVRTSTGTTEREGA